MLTGVDAKMKSRLGLLVSSSGRIEMARTALFLLLFCATNASLALLYPFSFSHILLAISLYALGTGVMLFLLCNPRNAWLVSSRSQVKQEGCVALTFDDGPDPVYPPRLLD